MKDLRSSRLIHAEGTVCVIGQDQDMTGDSDATEKVTRKVGVSR